LLLLLEHHRGIPGRLRSIPLDPLGVCLHNHSIPEKWARMLERNSGRRFSSSLHSADDWGGADSDSRHCKKCKIW
jgi:hypothetical protein